MLYLKPILLAFFCINLAWGEETNITDTYICEEDDVVTLACPKNLEIKVMKVLYGRQRMDQCNVHRKTLPRDCYSQIATQIVMRFCHKKALCRLRASNDMFGDPCPGVPKYLWVRWSCLPTQSWNLKTSPRDGRITVASGSQLNLTCTAVFTRLMPQGTGNVMIKWIDNIKGNEIFSSEQPDKQPKDKRLTVTIVKFKGRQESYDRRTTVLTIRDVKSENGKPLKYECEFRDRQSSQSPSFQVFTINVLPPTTTTPKPTTTTVLTTTTKISTARITHSYPTVTPTNDRCLQAKKAGIELCAVHAKCFDRGKSYHCQCAEGYSGDGRIRGACQKVPESFRKTWECPPPSGKNSGCNSLKLRQLKKKISAMDVRSQVGILTSFSNNETFSGGDLVVFSQLMTRVVDGFDSVKNQKDVTMNAKVIRQSIVQTTSSLLSKKVSWQNVESVTTRRSLVTNITTMVEKTCMFTTRDTKQPMVIDEPMVDVKVAFMQAERRVIDFRPGGSDEVQITSTDSSKPGDNARVVFVRYKGLRDYMDDNPDEVTANATKPKLVVFSNVISATASDSALVKTIRFRLSHDRRDEPQNASLAKKRCAYWNVANLTWAFDGCRVVNASSRDYTDCECDHLTSFAILLDFRGFTEKLPEHHRLSLSIITYVGCILSIFCCIFGVWTYDILRRSKGDRMNSEGRTSFFIYEMICLSLLVAQTVFLMGIYHTQIIILCRIVAALLHYFFLLLFEWMLMAGVYYILVYTQPYSIVTLDSNRGWVIIGLLLIPAIIVGISLGMRLDGYGTKAYCWLSVSDGLIWAFVGPVTAMLAINMILLSVLIVLTWRIKPSDMLETGEVNKGWVTSRARKLRYELLFCIVLGATWIFGYLLIENKTSLVFSYIFAILNSLQGVFILISYANWSRIRAAYIAEFRRKRWLPESFRRWLHSRQYSPGGPPGVGMVGSSASATGSQRTRTARGSGSQRGLLSGAPNAHGSDSAGALSHTTRTTRLGSGSSGGAKWSLSAGGHGMIDANDNSVAMVTETEAAYNENYAGHSMMDEPRQAFAEFDDRLVSEFASQSDAELLHMTAPLREHEEGGDHVPGPGAFSSSSSSSVASSASTTSPTSSYSDDAARTGAPVLDDLPAEPPKLPVVCSVPSPFAVHLPAAERAVTAPRHPRRPAGPAAEEESDYLLPTGARPQRHTLDCRARPRDDIELRASVTAKQKRFSQTDLYANADDVVYYSEPPLETPLEPSPASIERALAAPSRVTDV